MVQQVNDDRDGEPDSEGKDSWQWQYSLGEIAGIAEQAGSDAL